MHERAGKVQLNGDPSAKQDEQTRSGRGAEGAAGDFGRGGLIKIDLILEHREKRVLVSPRDNR